MKNKALIILLAATIGMVSCNQVGARAQDDTPEVTSNEDKKIDKPVNLNKKAFIEKVMDYENASTWEYKGDKPCIIDFWADWCGPCKKAAPVLDELAKEYAGEIYIYKINTDQERELAGAFGIRGIPAFLFVPMEGKPQMTSGVARTQTETKKMFTSLIDEILLNKPKVN